jgi:hypothetical protein
MVFTIFGILGGIRTFETHLRKQTEHRNFDGVAERPERRNAERRQLIRKVIFGLLELLRLSRMLRALLNFADAKYDPAPSAASGPSRSPSSDLVEHFLTFADVNIVATAKK